MANTKKRGRRTGSMVEDEKRNELALIIKQIRRENFIAARLKPVSRVLLIFTL